MLNRRTIRRMHDRLARFAADRRGASALEFALLAPLMIGLYLGTVEIAQGVSIDRKVSATARTVSDLVSQAKSVSDLDMVNILNAAAAVAAPYPTTNLKVVLSSVQIDAQGKATIAWSDALNTTKRPKDQTVILPAGLALPNSSLIWAEVEYNYTPSIGYVLTGPLKLSEQLYMRPRQSDSVLRTAL
jgi:Flp pilus assembly protein TadG